MSSPTSSTAGATCRSLTVRKKAANETSPSLHQAFASAVRRRTRRLWRSPLADLREPERWVRRRRSPLAVRRERWVRRRVPRADPRERSPLADLAVFSQWGSAAVYSRGSTSEHCAALGRHWLLGHVALTLQLWRHLRLHPGTTLLLSHLENLPLSLEIFSAPQLQLCASSSP